MLIVTKNYSMTSVIFTHQIIFQTHFSNCNLSVYNFLQSFLSIFLSDHIVITSFFDLFRGILFIFSRLLEIPHSAVNGNRDRLMMTGVGGRWAPDKNNAVLTRAD